MTGYRNPVIRGHAPDPSAVRVGDDYFLANSSFGFLPGIPISHSTDLVNWRTIGFAATRPAQYRRDGESGPVNLFAPTLRHHDGVFHLVCTNQADEQGNFLLRADDPAGEWSDAVWLDREAFDPSLFRDEDGQWYYTRRTLEFRPDGDLGPIVQTTIDLDSGALGEFHAITANNRGFESNDIEGPHLYRRGDWYYLTAAEGSSWKGHMQTIGRGRTPWGPFEPAPDGPILTHRHRVAHPIQTVGHAELIDDGAGNWWALSLGTRQSPFASHHLLGRETFLTPIEWPDGGWPSAVNRGTEPAYEGVTLPGGGRPDTDHKVRDSLWLRGWRTLGGPDPRLDPRADDRAIRLPAGADLTARPLLGALLRAQSEYDQTFESTIESDAGVIAGVAVYANSTHHYSALVTGHGDERRIRFRRVVDDLSTETWAALPGDHAIRLRITASALEYIFEMQLDDSWLPVGTGGARLLSAEAIEWFTNVNFALAAIGDAGSALFTSTRVGIPDTIRTPSFQLPY
ncbi:glycoside hydrolase family 43 protein [Microbacterium deminutum]|uniref:Glycoside hydrolase family 43 protein n=1 Tax=Microbacterium deminutum TaxID=344164 RepID=A0ABN2QY60_9MICO